MNKFTILFISALVCFEYSNGAPGIHNALLYLSRFGYIEPSTRINSSKNGALMDEKSYVKAIEEFQSFAGLEVTGNLDKQTVTAMSLPRCGVKDIVGTGSSRSKRYALQGSRWKVKNLKYRITKYPAKLKRSAVDKTVQDAFNVWTEYTDLVFSPSSGSKVHIDIRFERGEHGDGDPFDGPGGTLAHAFFPVYGGDAHFDASEQWTIDSYSGTNLFQVAAHEFGHSLGLSHSDVRSALMAPFYRGYDPAFNLDEDDVTAIQSLYGHKTRKSDKPDDFDSGYDDTKHINKKVPAPTPNSDENLCKSPKMDTIFTTPEDDSTFMFKGDKFWKLEEKAIASGYPKAISEGWPGLPNNIDAAFGHQNGKTYFFKGSKYWRYKGKVMENGYPKEISEGFTGIPDNVDAALVWSGNGKIYFFKGAKFWRFDPTSKPPVKSTYPKPIANWEGVPDNLDAAFKWSNGYTYFFKNGAYYRFNDRSFAVDSDPVPFPRSVEYWWYGCSGAPEGTVGTSESLGELRSGVTYEESNDFAADTDDLHHLIEEDGPSKESPPVALPGGAPKITLSFTILTLLIFLNSIAPL